MANQQAQALACRALMLCNAWGVRMSRSESMTKLHRNMIIAALALTALAPAYAAGGGGGGGGAPSESTPAYNPAMDYQKGTAAYKSGDYKTAAKHFKKVVGALPKDAAAQYLLGASLMGTGDFKKAKAPLEKAVKLDGKMIEARRDLAITYLKLGNKDKAQAQSDALNAMFKACAGTCPEAAKLEGAGNRIKVEMNQTKTSQAPIAPNIQLAEAKSADETYVTAVSLINEKRYEEAIAYLKEARWAAGPHPDILTYLGFANRKLKRYDLAEGFYQAALEIAPEHRGALEYYGELKLERGNVAGAKAHLAKLEAICGFGCNEADELRRLIGKLGITEKVPSAS
jgi:tetratricopeptide (TPR) repeat protein